MHYNSLLWTQLQLHQSQQPPGAGQHSFKWYKGILVMAMPWWQHY